MTKSSYIMRDQVRGLIADLENYNVTRATRRAETRLHLLAVTVVTCIYLIAVAILD